MSMKKTVSFRFIFYSFLTVVLFVAGHRMAPALSREFLQNSELWRDPVLAGVLTGFGVSLLGVYILLNRIVFVSLAISQSAGLGIFFTFWMAALLGISIEGFYPPLLGGLAFAVISAGIFAWLRRHKNFSESSLLGLIYILSAGLTIVLGDRISEGKHDIENLLFGSAVAISPETLHLVAVATALIFILHLLFRREFLYVSADPIFMKTRGLSPRFWSTLLYFLFTFGITVGLRTLGGLPIFALIVIPPFIALKGARSLFESFGIAIFLGALLPALGYYYSYVFSIPTGASLIFVGGIYLVGSLLESLVLNFFKKTTSKFQPTQQAFK